MTIRFAAPPTAFAGKLDRKRARETMALAANDNAGTVPDEAVLHAALRHFAAHGLAAAQGARRQAEAAFFAGDRKAYQWWLEICRTLDRRLARELDGHARKRN